MDKPLISPMRRFDLAAGMRLPQACAADAPYCFGAMTTHRFGSSPWLYVRT